VFVFKTDPQWAMQNEWRPQCTIEAFNARAVTAVAFSWRRLYTAGSDGSLRLWDVQFAYDPVTKDKTGIAGLSLVVTMVSRSILALF
jgi:WD40 repeat protein